MGKIKFGSFVVDGRGKVNGHVLSKNRYGSYIRTKVSPVNPQTSYQQDQRQLLGNLSSSWRGLTQNERDSWINAAPSFPVTNIFGDPVILSGQALYVGLNTNLSIANQATITTAPAPVAIPPIALTTLTADVSSNQIDASFSLASVPVGYSLMIFSTPNITPGRSFVKNRYRFIGSTTLTSNVADLFGPWTSRFGTMVPGDKIFVKAFLISNTSGQAGVPTAINAIITA